MAICLCISFFCATGLILFILFLLNKDNKDTFPVAFMGALVAIFVLSGINILMRLGNQPISAMDVYQGKTTLKYEVVDGIKVDSTVVWEEHYDN